MQLDRIMRVHRAHTRVLTALTRLSVLALGTLEQPSHTLEHVCRLTNLTRLVLGALRPVEPLHLALLQRLPDLLDLAVTYTATLPPAAVAAIAAVTTIRFLNLIPLHLENAVETPSLTRDAAAELAPMTQLLSLKLIRNILLATDALAPAALGLGGGGQGAHEFGRPEVRAAVRALSAERRRAAEAELGFLQPLLGLVLLQHLDVSGIWRGLADAAGVRSARGVHRVCHRERRRGRQRRLWRRSDGRAAAVAAAAAAGGGDSW